MAWLLLTGGWCLALQGAAWSFGALGLHVLPRQAPRIGSLLLWLAGAALIGWQASLLGAGSSLAPLVLTLPAAFLISLLLSSLVPRHPDWAWTRGPTEVQSSEITLVQDPGATALWLHPLGARCRVAVAILHGGGNDRLFGLEVLIDRLLRSGCDVFTANLPGHGRGGRDRFSLQACRVRLDALVDAAHARSDRVVLLGQSLGGSLVLDRLARGQPADAVVAVSAPARLRLGLSLWRELRALTRSAALGVLRRGNLLESLPAFGSFRRTRFPVRADGPYLAAFSAAIGEMDLPRRLSASPPPGVPVLLLNGTFDGVVPPAQVREMARALGERARLCLVPGATHLDILLDGKAVGVAVEWALSHGK